MSISSLLKKHYEEQEKKRIERNKHQAMHHHEESGQSKAFAFYSISYLLSDQGLGFLILDFSLDRFSSLWIADGQLECCHSSSSVVFREGDEGDI